jgi:peptide/histidine transporter 3/4
VLRSALVVELIQKYSFAAYDLFYSEVPENMRSACQALNLLTTTLGYIVAGAINSIFSFWITTDLNHGHLEHIFRILAALLAASLAVFLYISQSFEYSATKRSLATPSADVNEQLEIHEQTNE